MVPTTNLEHRMHLPMPNASAVNALKEGLLIFGIITISVIYHLFIYNLTLAVMLARSILLVSMFVCIYWKTIFNWCKLGGGHMFANGKFGAL